MIIRSGSQLRRATRHHLCDNMILKNHNINSFASNSIPNQTSRNIITSPVYLFKKESFYNFSFPSPNLLWSQKINPNNINNFDLLSLAKTHHNFSFIFSSVLDSSSTFILDDSEKEGSLDNVNGPSKRSQQSNPSSEKSFHTPRKFHVLLGNPQPDFLINTPVKVKAGLYGDLI